MGKSLVFVILLCQMLVAAWGKPSVETAANDDIVYEPTWESLATRPLPDWYDDAKVGIFIHWGVYSVPSYGTDLSEWFWWQLEGEKRQTNIDYMNANYKPGFTYQDFAEQFTAEFFDATEWAKLFEDSGAKYVVLTSKHHEGYALWPSKYSFSWNSMDVGPHRNIIEELSTAIRENTSLRFGLYHSLFEWFNRMYMEDKDNNYETDEFVTKKVLPELYELVNLFHPDLVWSDGDWDASPEYWKSTEFIAWLYNESPVRDYVVTNDRWGKGTLCTRGDFHTCADRYNPGVLQPYKWENAMTIDRDSWGHRQHVQLKDYMTSKELVKELVITVSTGGNILINVGPSKYGTIEAIFEERLRDLGTWLKINGDSIYSSRPWTAQKDEISSNVWYTSKPAENGKTYVYAIILDYPFETNQVELGSVASLVDQTTEVVLLGATDQKLTIDVSDTKIVKVGFPEKHLTDRVGLNFAWVLRFTV